MADTQKATQRVAFIGLGAMGGPMAANLVKAKLSVTGYDVNKDAMTRLVKAGGHAADSPAKAAADVELLIVMVVDAQQVEDVLFGENGALGALPTGSTIMVSSTVSPNFTQDLAGRIKDIGYEFLDAPVSGGVVRAEGGTLTVMASGSPAAFAACERALDAVAQKVYRLGDSPGTGSTVKMINQLLAGVHIAAAAEAIALGTRAGADPRVLYDVISNSAGASWMFNNRVPHMLEGDYTPLSALNIFVKDLGIVLDYGKQSRFPLPLTAAAHQMFLMGAAAGLGREDDSALVKIFEQIAGINVSAPEE
jgi:putative dehydrogenase